MPIKFIISPEGWGNANLENIEAVLCSVHLAFSPCFGSALSSSALHIKHYSQYPCCVREDKTIYLSASDCYWAKYAYQFSHEYCHFQIPKSVPSPLRWFEESICELASYYFLPVISKLWFVFPPYPNWKSYAPAFEECIVEDAKKAVAFDLNFSNPDNPNLNALSLHEYDRPKNAYIAQNLLPIFQADPTLWKELPLLCQLPKEACFVESLRTWHSLVSPEHQNSIAAIANIFSLSI